MSVHLERHFKTEPFFSRYPASWQSAAQIKASKDQAGQWSHQQLESKLDFIFFKPYSRYRSHEVLDH